MTDGTQWYTARELAEMQLPGLPTTERGIAKKAQSHEWEYQEVDSRGGPNGKKKEYPETALPPAARAELLQRRLELGRSSTHPPATPAPAITAPTANPALPAVADGGRTLPALAALPESYRQQAEARADLVTAFALERQCARSAGSKTMPQVRGWIERYNRGEILPAIRGLVGPVTLSKLYAWERRFRTGGAAAIAGYRRPHNRGRRGVSEEEAAQLLKILLHPNRRSVASAARMVRKATLRQGRPACSERTYIRWANDFRERNWDHWTRLREGEKAYQDKINIHLRRDWSDVAVGELLVADGHTLNALVIDPHPPHKARRLAVVMFIDARSRMPLGWEIMATESIQCIHSALFNSIVFLGKEPVGVLFDNGRGFKARMFTGDLRDVDFEQTGMRGLYAELGIETHFAKPYNAKSKPIERFFKTFNDFERLLPMYCGRNTDDKPALMKRNERRLQALYPADQAPLTVEQLNQAMGLWLTDYANEPHDGLDGATPYEVFMAGRGPGVDPAGLAARMLLSAPKPLAVRNGTVSMHGIRYYHPELQHLRQAQVRYTLQDLRRIWLFDTEWRYVGCGEPLEDVPALARGADMETLKRQLREQQRNNRESHRESKAVLELAREIAGGAPALPPPEENLFALPKGTIPAPAEVEEQLDAAGARAPEMVEFLRKLSAGPFGLPETATEPEAPDDSDPEDAIEERLCWQDPRYRYEYLQRRIRRGFELTEKQTEFLNFFQVEYHDYIRTMEA